MFNVIDKIYMDQEHYYVQLTALISTQADYNNLHYI